MRHGETEKWTTGERAEQAKVDVKETSDKQASKQGHIESQKHLTAQPKETHEQKTTQQCMLLHTAGDNPTGKRQTETEKRVDWCSAPFLRFLVFWCPFLSITSLPLLLHLFRVSVSLRGSEHRLSAF